jgi:outer membrane biosynthesis protein TonB
VLFIGLGTATLNASGDSVLYGVRVAVEDAAVALHTDPEDRSEYLLSLLDARQAEAARLEASGNALAASRVREIEHNTLRALQAVLPQVPDENAPAVVPAPTESPTPTPATPSPTPSLAPTATPAPPSATPARTATPRPTTPPTPTPTPARTATPPPTPTGTPFPVTATGTVKNADGTKAAGVCVFAPSNTSTCITTTASDGTYRVTFSGRINQTFYLYFTRQDGTTLWKGSASATIHGSLVTMPTVTLQK